MICLKHCPCGHQHPAIVCVCGQDPPKERPATKWWARYFETSDGLIGKLDPRMYIASEQIPKLLKEQEKRVLEAARKTIQKYRNNLVMGDAGDAQYYLGVDKALQMLQEFEEQD